MLNKRIEVKIERKLVASLPNLLPLNVARFKHPSYLYTWICKPFFATALASLFFYAILVATLERAI